MGECPSAQLLSELSSDAPEPSAVGTSQVTCVSMADGEFVIDERSWRDGVDTVNWAFPPNDEENGQLSLRLARRAIRSSVRFHRPFSLAESGD